MIVPDINLLIYAYNVDAPASDAAQDWWKKLLSVTETVGVPWAVATGFVRIITNPRIMDSPLPLETAADRVQGWFDYDHVTPLNPGDRHLALFRRNLDVEGSGSNSVTDAHIAALAMEYDAEVHTNDAGFARFPGLRWHNPIR